MHTDVLLIEDEAELAHAVADHLTAFGLTCHHVTTAEDGMAALVQGTVGIVLLDVSLPGMKGFRVLPRPARAQRHPRHRHLGALA